MVTALLFGITEYYTSTRFSPVKKTAAASVTGHATNIIQGFASGLQAVATSAPVPVALVVNVGGRLPQDRADGVQGALLHLAGTPAGSATLGRLKLNGFVPPRLPATPGS